MRRALAAKTPRGRAIDAGVAGALLLAASMLGPRGAIADADTVIHVTFVERHDRLPPDPMPDIERQHSVTATLTAENRVLEHDENVRLNGGGRHGWRGPKVRTHDSSETIGEKSGRVVWHVLGPHKLQRIFEGRQFLMTIEIAIETGGQCRVEVKYLLQKGYTDIFVRRADNGEFAHFSLPRVESASCTIE